MTGQLLDDTADIIFIGSTEVTPQFGLIGEYNGKKVAIDLNGPTPICVFGLQGSGKSYTVGSITEMATMPISNINKLDHPLASVFFHYNSTEDFIPEFTSMVTPNDDQRQLELLYKHYNAQPQALSDVVLITTADKVESTQRAFPGIEVKPLKFSSRELQDRHWKILMSAVSNKAMYLRKLKNIMREYKDDLSVQLLREAISNSGLSDELVELALMRLDFAEEFIDDDTDIGSLLQPGRLIIVDIRDGFIDKDEALGLFLILLNIFSVMNSDAQRFNKLFIFDECHKYLKNDGLVEVLREAISQHRHTGISIILASQDPPSVPRNLISLSHIIFIHKLISKDWIDHLAKASGVLRSLTEGQLNALSPGEAFVWALKSTEEDFTFKPRKIACRPRVTRHGGETLTLHTSLL